MRVLQVVEPGVDGVFRHVEGLTQFLASQAVGVSLAYSDVRSSDGLRRLVAEVQAHGGNGVASEYGLLPYWGLARLLKIAPVNREMILNYVAQHSLGLPRSY